MYEIGKLSIFFQFPLVETTGKCLFYKVFRILTTEKNHGIMHFGFPNLVFYLLESGEQYV